MGKKSNSLFYKNYIFWVVKNSLEVILKTICLSVSLTLLIINIVDIIKIKEINKSPTIIFLSFKLIDQIYFI